MINAFINLVYACLRLVYYFVKEKIFRIKGKI